MRLNDQVNKVRLLTSSFFELQQIKNAGFNFVVATDELGLYNAGFHHFSDADLFAFALNLASEDIEHEKYEVYNVKELMDELDRDACTMLYEEEEENDVTRDVDALRQKNRNISASDDVPY